MRRHYSTNRCLSVSSKVTWFSIPVSLGIVCIATLQLCRVIKRERERHKLLPASPQPLTWQLTSFLILPTRTLSRAWGFLMDLQLPSWSRRPLLGLYTSVYGCNLEESERESINDYTSFSDLFTRKLKEGRRPINELHELVSPCDGKVLHYGSINEDCIEQVKGVQYSLSAFLGPELLEKSPDPMEKIQLYHIVLYLGPGDVHHFYSPAKWTVKVIRHIPGELVTVAPWAARTMPGLFALNERTVLSGVWMNRCYFSLSAVGAYNVGSIKLTAHKELQTNKKEGYVYGTFTDSLINDIYPGKEDLVKGSHVGYFKMGSSIVLIFEAPKSFEFVIKNGQYLRIGEPLGIIKR